jgi:predicted ATP-dependent protease
MMNNSRHPLELAPDDLRRVTKPSNLGFQTTAELGPAPEIVGQDRAREAIDFALRMRDNHYNLFVTGVPGTGRQTTVLRAVERAAQERPAPRDWCYVRNFARPQEPRALALPAGNGPQFARDVEAFVRDCRFALHRAFRYRYKTQVAEVVQDIAARHDELAAAITEKARRLGLALKPLPQMARRIARQDGPVRAREPSALFPAAQALSRQSGAGATGLSVGAVGGARLSSLPPSLRANESLPSAEPEHQPPGVQDAWDTAFGQMVAELETLDDEALGRIQRFTPRVAAATVRPLADALIARYADLSDVVQFIRALAANIMEHADLLRQLDDAAADVDGSDEGEDSRPGAADGANGGTAALDALMDRLDVRARLAVPRLYQVNVLVTHAANAHAPIVHEARPTAGNLLGRTEVAVLDGQPYTDHLMIQAGAVHRANDGYLIVHALDLARDLEHPVHAGNVLSPWEAIRQTLHFETITPDSGEGGLRPQPIPANIRIIVIGDFDLYLGFLTEDPEFRQLFKMRADFDSEMPCTPQNQAAYAAFVGDAARAAGGPPLAAEAVALLIEEGSRWVSHQERLSTRFGDVRDLTQEACYWARTTSAVAVTRQHVLQAIRARERRLGLQSEKERRDIQEGLVRIETTGLAVGQINGLSASPLEEYVTALYYPDGLPLRITARTWAGLAGVVDIAREIDQSDTSHDKGVLSLIGFLSGRFAQDFPLSFGASLSFEQEDDGTSGDSASAAELFALLSDLAKAPIKQSLAVTGALGQRGEIQPIGGVNYKIEGFFRVCRERGLTGEQGVIIPRANARDLMLRDEVVEAVRQGQFHIYAIDDIDQGIPLLMDRPAKEINERVLARLRAYGKRVRTYGPGAR